MVDPSRGYLLTPVERNRVDEIKSAGKFPSREALPHVRRLYAIAVAEMAEEKGDIEVCDYATGNVYHIPGGTPWDEILPVPEEELEK